jgi:hypothetical protein
LLLAEEDRAHGTISGQATVHLLRRALQVQGKPTKGVYPGCHPFLNGLQYVLRTTQGAPDHQTNLIKVGRDQRHTQEHLS